MLSVQHAEGLHLRSAIRGGLGWVGQKDLKRKLTCRQQATGWSHMPFSSAGRVVRMPLRVCDSTFRSALWSRGTTVLSRAYQSCECVLEITCPLLRRGHHFPCLHVPAPPTQSSGPDAQSQGWLGRPGSGAGKPEARGGPASVESAVPLSPLLRPPVDVGRDAVFPM